MDDDQQFCLRWNNHQTTLISVFDTLLEKGMHVDCSLAAEGKTLKAHKVVLSACSPYFENVLSQQYDKHPIIILKDVKYAELRAMMDYMYRGEVNISQDQLAALLKAAESLQIKGLSDNKPPRPSSPSVKSKINESVSTLQSREGSSSPVPRKRKKPRRTSTDILNHNHTEPLITSTPPVQTHTPLALPLPLPHPVPVAVPIAVPPSAPIAKPAVEPINLNLENNIAPATPKLKMGDIMNNIVKNNKVDNNNMELGVAKLEFGSEGPEESVEDLTLDEEGEGDGDGAEGEEEGAGSSKYGDIVQNFQCYMERSQDEAALSGQDGTRDSQDGKEGQIPSALLSLLTARNLQSMASSLAAAPLSIRLPGVAATIEEKASLIQRAILQNNNVLPHGCIVDVKSDIGKYEDEESDIEYDDTDDILLPDDSEVFYACSEAGSADGGESGFGGEGGGEGCEGGKAGDDPSRQFQCRHCGKRYRWKSTLRRHENVECGGKPPSHQCPYCAYKAKQRGNLGVHIRKHHNKEWQLYADNKLRKAKKAQA